MFYSLTLLLFLNGGRGLWARAGIERERERERDEAAVGRERERETGTEILGTVLWLTKFRLCGHIRGPLHVTPDPVHLPTPIPHNSNSNSNIQKRLNVHMKNTFTCSHTLHMYYY